MSQTLHATQQIDIQQFGALRQEYKVRYSGPIRAYIILFPLATIILLLTGVLQSSDPSTMDSANGAFFLAAILALPSLYYLLYPVIYHSWRVSVYSGGFAFAHGSKRDVLSWDQIDSVTQRIVKRRFSVFFILFTITSHRYLISDKDGRKIVLHERISQVEEAGTLITREYNALIRPQLVASYKAGNDLSFGPLSISQQGLNNGKELVSWDQIAEIDLNERTGVLSFKKTGKLLNLVSLQSHLIPNVIMFLEMVDLIRRKRM